MIFSLSANSTVCNHNSSDVSFDVSLQKNSWEVNIKSDNKRTKQWKKLAISYLDIRWEFRNRAVTPLHR